MQAEQFQLMPLNRVEGDLEIHYQLDAHATVIHARSVGTMYRGIENLLLGRSPLDALVITPRICGICTTAHLQAAAKALDMAFNAKVPDNGRRLRAITLLTELVQNDLRHSYMLFLPDLISEAYAHLPMYAEAQARYRPMQGSAVVPALQFSQKVLEIIAILGGQWPHSSFMVPGGVVTLPSATDIHQCRHTLNQFRIWYQQSVLGCDLERWLAVQSLDDLKKWLAEEKSHRQSELGFFLRWGKAIGLDRLGVGPRRWISYGGPDLPKKTQVQAIAGGDQLFAAGIYEDGRPMALNEAKITEDTTATHYKDSRFVRHPFEGRTVAEPGEADAERYSWAKAPRYDGLPAETGPLADLAVSGHPLVRQWLSRHGPSVLLRQMVRMVRTALVLPAMEHWLDEMGQSDGVYYHAHEPKANTQGYGLVTAPRGALGHWVRIEKGRIAQYQVVTPTGWNGSPCDRNGHFGPWETALLGTRVADVKRPIELEHIVRSFDPCLVCTVHAVTPR